MPFQHHYPLYTAEPSSRFPTHSTIKPTSRTHSLILRTPTSNDAPALVRHFSDKRNTKHDLSVHGLDNAVAVAALIEQWRTVSSSLKGFNLVVEVEGELVGVGGFGWIGVVKGDEEEEEKEEEGKKETRKGERIGDAGIMLDTRVRGKGYAVEALRITMDYGFRMLDLDACRLAATDENLAMKGLMEKRFGLEGKRVEKDRFGNDWVWTLRRKEWEEWEEWQGEMEGKSGG